VRGEYTGSKMLVPFWIGSPPRAWGIHFFRRCRGRRFRFTPTCVGNTSSRTSTAPGWSVHPHVRGEYIPNPLAHDLVLGSPPRAWGILRWAHFRVPPSRFTPTCVGNTALPRDRASVSPVHPHVCGEYLVLYEGENTTPGSPPRAWGIRRNGPGRSRGPRFTPTCVGNTCSNISANNRHSVHPHVRGEYYLVDAFPLRIRGSPPRAWGIRGSCAVFPFQFRFTPTCVGNTRSTCSSRHSVAVHPHVRGEYTGLRAQIATRVGSPPRAWGILIRVLHGSYSSRFTPTCVGNTGEGFLISAPSPVHPHVRGEYEITQPTSTSPYGSPPRAWGIHYSLPESGNHHRFTPTCVGNTTPVLAFCYPGSVHPHVRGEYVRYAVHAKYIGGSPPRAWGILTKGLIGRESNRFTPTCVGNTLFGFGGCSGVSVHPHVRGEYKMARTMVRSGLGSPPRAWGILFRLLLESVSCRFTPTCVGNTTRGRGRLAHLRFTPTCVGNTRHAEPDAAGFSVHPHVRGEYRTEKVHCSPTAGSPPRAWGIRASAAPPSPATGSPPRAWGIRRRGR